MGSEKTREPSISLQGAAAQRSAARYAARRDRSSRPRSHTRPQLRVVSRVLNAVTTESFAPKRRIGRLKTVAVPRMWGYMATYQASGIARPSARARATSQYSA